MVPPAICSSRVSPPPARSGVCLLTQPPVLGGNPNSYSKVISATPLESYQVVTLPALERNSPPTSNPIVATSSYKSFAGLFESPGLTASLAGLPIKPPCSYRGKPAAFFSAAEVSELAQPFQYALVGKFAHGRPSMADIRAVIETFGLKGRNDAGLLDAKNVLLRFCNEEDFHRFWSKEQWSIKRCPMRVSKWTPEYQIGFDSPLVPVWISLPLLPIHYFSKSALFSITCGIGRPLRIDHATASLLRPSLARVCVELDVSQPLSVCVWIGNDEHKEVGFWQAINYEHIPLFCSHCHKLGHDIHSCYVKNPTKVSAKVLRKQQQPLVAAAPRRTAATQSVNHTLKFVPKTATNRSTTAAAKQKAPLASVSKIITAESVFHDTLIDVAPDISVGAVEDMHLHSLLDATPLQRRTSPPADSTAAVLSHPSLIEFSKEPAAHSLVKPSERGEGSIAFGSLPSSFDVAISSQRFPNSELQNQISTPVSLEIPAVFSEVLETNNSAITAAWVQPDTDTTTDNLPNNSPLISPISAPSYATVLCRTPLNVNATAYVPKKTDFTSGSHIPGRLSSAPSLDNFLLYSAERFQYTESKLIHSLVLANFEINWSSHYTYNFDEIKAKLRQDK